MSMSSSSIITGHGSYLPEKILTNYDLEKIVDTSHDWIIEQALSKDILQRISPTLIWPTRPQSGP